jgi:prevent-host-death family protein
MQINIHDAKSKLSALLLSVENGEDVVIARAGKPVARLVPYVKAPGGMLLGLARSSALHIPDDATLAEMDREVEAMFATSESVFPAFAVQEPRPLPHVQRADTP